MDFAYKKSLGQNFIYDTNYLARMIAPLKVASNDLVIEIGTGAGTLTQVLASYNCQVQTYEIDQRLLPSLQTKFANIKNITLIHGDALKQDFRNLPKFRLIANVPYYITTPLIMKFLNMPNCTELNILVAKEVAERIIASVGTKEYGALSITCQLMADCKILQIVPRTVFTPQPKIDSAFVRLIKNQTIYDITLSKLLKGIFANRRKTILNAIVSALNVNKSQASEILKMSGVNENLRPEQLTPTMFAQINKISAKYL